MAELKKEFEPNLIQVMEWKHQWLKCTADMLGTGAVAEPGGLLSRIMRTGGGVEETRTELESEALVIPSRPLWKPPAFSSSSSESEFSVNR
jgi:hypothetical protein